MSRIMEEYAKEYAEEYARESSIQAFISACKLCKDTFEGTTKKLMEKFGLSYVDAAQKVSEFWESGSTDQTN